MATIDTLRRICLAYEETTEEPHFEKTSFRVKKKIFVTYGSKTDEACVLLRPDQQSVYCSIDSSVIYPVPNKWGLKGATFIRLKNIKISLLKDMVNTSYCNVAPVKLKEKYWVD